VRTPHRRCYYYYYYYYYYNSATHYYSYYFYYYYWHTVVVVALTLTHTHTLTLSGLKGGKSVFQCLEYCLRKNRSLSSLRCDGMVYAPAPGAHTELMLDGWKALRGCLYGNKKLLEIPVMWTDINKFFKDSNSNITANMARATAIKPAISQAHRARNHSLKAQKIDEMVAFKKTFKALDRDKAKAAAVLTAIYSSVEQNAASALAVAEHKLELNMQKPYIRKDMATLGEKMGAHLGKLRDAITLACENTLAAETETETGVEIGAGAEGASAQRLASASRAGISAAFGRGVYFFEPDAYTDFACCVESGGLDVSPRLINALTQCGAFIDLLGAKADKYNHPLPAFLAAIADALGDFLADFRSVGAFAPCKTAAGAGKVLGNKGGYKGGKKGGKKGKKNKGKGKGRGRGSNSDSDSDSRDSDLLEELAEDLEEMLDEQEEGKDRGRDRSWRRGMRTEGWRGRARTAWWPCTRAAGPGTCRTGGATGGAAWAR
jgi:hypothetical protein